MRSKCDLAMLVSIQVASGCSILKNWGIHSITDSSTVHKVHVALRDRTLEGLMYFEFLWSCETNHTGIVIPLWPSSGSTVNII